MVTYISDYFNTNTKISSQKDYDTFLKQVIVEKIVCPCCGKVGYFIYYGVYERGVYTSTGTLMLTVQRLQCVECGSTHALFPPCLVAYQRMQLQDQIYLFDEIEETDRIDNIGESFPYLDGDYLYYLYENYLKHWKERLLSMMMSLKDDIFELIRRSFDEYKRQFLQISSLRNSLNSVTT